MRLGSAIVWLCLVCTSRAEDASKPLPIKEPELRLELIHRAEADQDVRGAVTKWIMQFGSSEFANEATLNATQKAEYQKFADKLRQVDTENTEALGKIVERYGWPTYSLVGKDGADAACLLVQHADLSPKFQRMCLDRMLKVPDEEISRKNVAYLTDRVLLAEGKKQIYGTQITLKDGKCQPRALEDEANVDKRRAEVGLSPLAEYMKEIESIYTAPPSSR